MCKRTSKRNDQLNQTQIFLGVPKDISLHYFCFCFFLSVHLNVNKVMGRGRSNTGQIFNQMRSIYLVLSSKL